MTAAASDCTAGKILTLLLLQFKNELLKVFLSIYCLVPRKLQGLLEVAGLQS